MLGANDGIVSTACLIIAVAAAGASRHAVVLAGISALVAGAFSMAIGEYTSVSSQRDAEQADIAKERLELAETPERELRELTRIYIDKGLSHDLAHEVAVELSRGDVLAVHMAEELGLTHETLARPTQAAGSSAIAFSLGALIPLLAVLAFGWSTSRPGGGAGHRRPGRSGRPGGGRCGRRRCPLRPGHGPHARAWARWPWPWWPCIGHLVGVAAG